MHALGARSTSCALFKHDTKFNVAAKYEEPSIFHNNELIIFTLFTFFHVSYINIISCNKYNSCNCDTNGIDLPLILNKVYLQTSSHNYAPLTGFRYQ